MTQTIEIPNDIDDAPIVDLPDDAGWGDFQIGVNYLGTVDNITDYGIFVHFTPSYEAALSGLVHKKNLGYFERTHEFTLGQYVVVTPIERRSEDELSCRLVDSMWDKEVDDLDVENTYYIDGYPNLSVGDNVSSDEVTVEDVADVTIEEPDPEEIAADEDPSPDPPDESEPGPRPKADTKIGEVLYYAYEADKPVTSSELNDALDTDNTASQLNTLWNRMLLERQQAPPEVDSEFEYVITEDGVEAAEGYADATDDPGGVYPLADDEADETASEPADDAESDSTDAESETDSHDPGVEEKPRDLERALDRIEEAHREGYTVRSTRIRTDPGTLDVHISMEEDDDAN